jgi:hypothetical protein
MNTNKQLSKWIVDAGLLIGFLVAFFLDLTGVDGHQWLGIALAGLAGYHLITHWNWVKAVTAKLFGRISGQARLYYWIDAGLLVGFGMITITGLVISTWLDLPLDNYAAWKDVHVFSSVTTLLLTVVKIGLHWRWIVNVARQAFQKSKPVTLWPNSYQPAPAMLNRRHFLSLMGIVGLASWAAIHNVVSEEDGVKAETLAEEEDYPEAISTATSAPLQNKVSATQVPTQSAAKATAAPATASKSTPVAPTRAATTAAMTNCKVRCNKRCAYPGRCRRYVDTNNNKKCDLGECV